jgi:hypothetical protein
LLLFHQHRKWVGKVLILCIVIQLNSNHVS